MPFSWFSSVAARRAAAGLLCVTGFDGPDERAEEPSIYVRGDGVHVDSLPCEKFAGVRCAIDARGLDLNLGETCSNHFTALIVLFESVGDATYPCGHTP